MEGEIRGTLQSKMARIGWQLEMCKERFSLSIPYPGHAEKLKSCAAQLDALIR